MGHMMHCQLTLLLAYPTNCSNAIPRVSNGEHLNEAVDNLNREKQLELSSRFAPATGE